MPYKAGIFNVCVVLLPLCCTLGKVNNTLSEFTISSQCRITLWCTYLYVVLSVHKTFLRYWVILGLVLSLIVWASMIMFGLLSEHYRAVF